MFSNTKTYNLEIISFNKDYKLKLIINIKILNLFSFQIESEKLYHCNYKLNDR